MTDIIVEVEKGMVTGLYCDIADARFVVVDWDVQDGEDGRQFGTEQDHAKLRSLPAKTKAEYLQAVS